jgi:hypothetical protein
MKKWFYKTKRPILALAPMHSVSQSPLRISCRKAGADVVYSEMIASEAIIRFIPQTYEMMKFTEIERPIIIQIFGNNPDSMAQAAEIIENKVNPDGIDINFGCPVQKAAKQGFGAVQLSDSDNAVKIVRSVKKVLKKTPLSIKIRLVTKNISDTLGFVSKMVEAGIDMIAIHGRTPTQKYGGVADWSHAYEIKKLFPNIIVLGNGDIKSAEDLKNKIGNLDGVLVGRAAKVSSKIFTELKNQRG